MHHPISVLISLTVKGDSHEPAPSARLATNNGSRRCVVYCLAIIAFDLDTHALARYFDASDLGILAPILTAFHLEEDGSLLLSFDRTVFIPNIPGLVDQGDIVRFVPVTLGEETVGTFELFLDGSDVNLTGIFGLSRAPDGRLVVSTAGDSLHVFNAATWGEATTGSFATFFDLDAVGMADNFGEETYGLWIDGPAGELYLTTHGDYTTGDGLSGDQNDVLRCTLTTQGTGGGCTFTRFWDGNDYNITRQLDALHISRPRPTPGTLSGQVFLDNGYDGQIDAGDSPWANVLVTLHTLLGAADSTTTDASGLYSFPAYPGRYSVRVAGQPGYAFVPQDVGNDATDSDVGADGRSATVVLSSTQTIVIDAGLGIPPTPTPTPTSTPTATPTQPGSPLPTATQPQSPLPTPTFVPTEEFPDTEAILLNPGMFETELSVAEKDERWSMGLPVPLVTASSDDEIDIIESVAVSSLPQHKRSGLMAAIPQLTTQVVDNWQEEDIEDFESSFPNSVDNCTWQRTQRVGGQDYIWGKAGDRYVSGSQAIWPAGDVSADASPGTQPLPANSTYPTNMVTSVICKLSEVNDTKNILAEFQMWYELADSGDSISVQFFSGTDSGGGISLTYKGGLEWRGSNSGLVVHDWHKYHIYYPNLLGSDDTIYVKWKFVSDNNNNAAKGPWFDDLAVSTYQQPQSSANCQDVDPTYASGLSKGLNIGPYSEDLKDGDPTKFSQMVDRLVAADVNWVRMEFSLNPSLFSLSNTNDDPVDPLTVLDGDNHIDLRQYDLFVDSLCALNNDNDPTNDIAILGLIDNTTLFRQDWKREDGQGIVVPNGYLLDFVDVAEELAEYFDDRIGAWEIWNEPDYQKSGLAANQYGALLEATYDALVEVDSDDIVLFTGLVGANDTALAYLNNTLTSLTSPKPFDIFALHPYFTEAYPGRNGEIADLDPAYYMRGDLSARPQTIVKKFRESLDDETKFDPNEQGKPIWATEVGWNSADGSMQCPNFLALVVDENEQACYLQRGFHSLFNLEPTVSKVFWFGYHDTAQWVEDDECGTTAGVTFSQVPSPSWYSSAVSNYFVLSSSPSDVLIPWSFGLYHGNIHLDIPEADKVKPVQAAFQNWPTANINCVEPWPELSVETVYLPLVSNDENMASGQ